MPNPASEVTPHFKAELVCDPSSLTSMTQIIRKWWTLLQCAGAAQQSHQVLGLWSQLLLPVPREPDAGGRPTLQQHDHDQRLAPLPPAQRRLTRLLADFSPRGTCQLMEKRAALRLVMQQPRILDPPCTRHMLWILMHGWRQCLEISWMLRGLGDGRTQRQISANRRRHASRPLKTGSDRRT